MIQLLQIFTHLARSGWTREAMQDEFRYIVRGDIDLEAFLDEQGLEFTPAMLPYLRAALPKWESALNVALMRLEVIQD